MKEKYQKSVDKLKVKHNISTLDYIGDRQFNFSCDVCNTKFSGDIQIKAGYAHPCPTCLKNASAQPKVVLTRNDYIDILTEMNYELMEKDIGMSKMQLVRCTVCGHEQSIKPVQKIQVSKNYEGGGRCTKCRETRIKEESYAIGQKYVHEIISRGYEVLSEGPYNQADKIDVIRKECGHQFNARLSYIWDGRSVCSVCNNTAKVERLKQSHMK